MTRKRLPSAAEIWEQIPLPAMAQQVETQGKAGLHVFRLSQGLDIYGKTVFVVECRDIFGMATEFTQFHSGVFYDERQAWNAYNTGKFDAKNEYKRLKKQYEARGGNYDE